MSETQIIKNINWIKEHEALVIKITVGICGVILAGVLIGLWQYGLDLSSVFLGSPSSSAHEPTRGIIALEGGVVAITILFGGLFVAGLIALTARR